MKFKDNLARKAEKLHRGKITKFVIIPMLLIFLWIFLSLGYSSYKSFSVLQYSHYQDQYDDFFDKKLLKGEKIRGVFKAKEDNLGIVVVKFGNVPKVDFSEEDSLIFRIKEIGQKSWQYENRYRSGLLTPYEEFPFGFEPIDGSLNKEYIFEIESLNGNSINSIETGRSNPIFLSKYKFSKEEIFSDYGSTLTFILKKIITLFTNIDILLSSTVFLLPLIFYLVLIVFTQKGFTGVVLLSSIDIKRIKDKIAARNLFTLVVLTFIFVDLFFSLGENTGLFIGLFGLWVIVLYLNRFSSRVTFILGFIIIVVSVLGLYFDRIASFDKPASFVYFLIVLGFIQIMREKVNLKKKIRD